MLAYFDTIFLKSVITIQNVTKSFGAKVAVDNISLAIPKGEVFGFLGPNGAGKTTTMKMIIGLLRPTKGSISLLEEPAGSLSVRKKIGFLPEFAHFYHHLSGLEFLRFVGEIFHLSQDDIRKRSKQLLQLVRLPVEAHSRQIGTYSKGMQQRIGMAQALMNDPEILFLDEPMSGLDPIGRREMKDIIIKLKKEGKTIFFNSHILADAEAICDRVGIIHLGKLLVHDTVQKIVPKGKTLEDIFIETVSGASTKSSSVPKKKVAPKKRKAVKAKAAKTSAQPKTAVRKKSPAKKPPKKTASKPKTVSKITAPKTKKAAPKKKKRVASKKS